MKQDIKPHDTVDRNYFRALTVDPTLAKHYIENYTSLAEVLTKGAAVPM